MRFSTTCVPRLHTAVISATVRTRPNCQAHHWASWSVQKRCLHESVPGVVVWQKSWQSFNRPHYTHLRLSCWHRDVHSRSFSGSKRGQTRQPVLDREGRKCLQRRLEWRRASQVASTTESLHKMWCENGQETLLDRIEPYCTELNNCVPC